MFYPPCFILVVFVRLFIVSFIGKVVHSFGKHDDEIIRNGEWLEAQSEFKKVKIVTNELRIIFCAGKVSFMGGTENFRSYAICVMIIKVIC